jgi:hypothetical protein
MESFFPMVRLVRPLVLTALALQLTGCGRDLAPSVPVFARSFQAQAQAAAPSNFGTASESITAMPRFTQTARGAQGDMVNLVVIASESTLKSAFAQAGWLTADPIKLGTVAKMGSTGLFGGHYPTAPMSALYLYGRIQDLAYQKNAVGIVARDHLRVWKAPMQDPQGRTFWAIAATKDVAVKFSHGLPTHRISPEIDTERQLVVDDFKATGKVVRHDMVPVLPVGFQGANGENDPYTTDGQVAVLELADSLLPQ